MRGAAVQRGARLLAPATIRKVEKSGEHFVAEFQSRNSVVTVTADFIIDASGRQSTAARSLGAVRQSDTPLLCRAIYGSVNRASTGAGVSFVEAVEDGWWYTAPLPRHRRILAFHTDANLARAASVQNAEGLLRHVTKTCELKSILTSVDFDPDSSTYGCPAGGGLLNPVAGPGWLAAGDAALTFEPLSSQGLFNALFMGLASAEAAHSYLSGNSSAISEYRATASDIRRAYHCAALIANYGRERRFPASAFWRQRQSGCFPRDACSPGF